MSGDIGTTLGAYQGRSYLLRLRDAPGSSDREIVGVLCYRQAKDEDEVKIIKVWNVGRKTYFDELYNEDRPVEQYGVTNKAEIIEAMEERWEQYASAHTETL